MNNGSLRLASKEEIFSESQTHERVKNSAIAAYYDLVNRETVLCKMCKKSSISMLIFVLEQEAIHHILNKLFGEEISIAFDNVHIKLGREHQIQKIYKFCNPDECTSYGKCFGW